MTVSEYDRVRRALLSAHATWHMCRLTKREGRLPKGRPCDSCIECAEAAMKQFKIREKEA